MSAMLISVPRIPGIGSEATTIPVRGGRENITMLCRVALIALPVLVSGAAARAQDAKTFPGAMCQPQRSTDTVSRNNDGRMLNASDSVISQTWICPVVRDTVSTATGVESAHMIVIGNAVSCSFHSMTQTGGTVFATFPDGNFQAPGNLRRLEYSVGSPAIPNAVGGYYHFRCSIPARLGVVMYEVNENDGEG